MAVLQRRGDPGGREGTVHLQGQHADLQPLLLAQAVDHVAELVGEGAHGDDDEVGVLAAVGVEDRRAAAAEALPEVGVDLLPELHGLAHLLVQVVADVHVSPLLDAVDVAAGIGQGHGVEALGVLRVEGMQVAIGRQEILDRLGLGELEGHVGVGEVVAVVVDHYRDVHRLGEPEGLQGHVDDFLVVLGEDLDPAGVALADGVLMVVPHRPGGADAAVDDAHHQRQAGAGRPVQLLAHVEQAVGGGRREGAHPGAGGTDADPQGAVLALDGDVFGVHLRPRRSSRRAFPSGGSAG